METDENSKNLEDLLNSSPKNFTKDERSNLADGKNESEGEEDDSTQVVKEAENAVPPKAWENQKKAYNDAFETIKINS
ncbi:hypothetical protein [Chryseobacterium sp. MP_3.2]|uniref:hypothetical protein n=1 Tax=Chryseobacterium sp. MP_3.2 TaxID=3071712 RepID=UPI002E04F886|nr:hypothetical protein [Chryseobacterium sp. MP_3.2]